jgi:predicted aldo/keto reductase-like oxidoreductase
MPYDSLIKSRISTRCKKTVSCASKISFPSVFSLDNKKLKVSEKAKPHDFYPENFNHAFLSKPGFECRNNS